MLSVKKALKTGGRQRKSKLEGQNNFHCNLCNTKVKRHGNLRLRLYYLKIIDYWLSSVDIVL